MSKREAVPASFFSKRPCMCEVGTDFFGGLCLEEPTRNMGKLQINFAVNTFFEKVADCESQVQILSATHILLENTRVQGPGMARRVWVGWGWGCSFIVRLIVKLKMPTLNFESACCKSLYIGYCPGPVAVGDNTYNMK